MDAMTIVRTPTLLLLLLLLAMAVRAAAAPLEADFWNCNPNPAWPDRNGNLHPDCCKLEALMRKPRPLYKTWKQYLEKHPLPKQPRVRQAAHLMANNETYLRQLDLAYQRLKALPDSNPISEFNIMNLHCVYGSPAVIKQANLTDRLYLVHNSWTFFPFHRWFTFFYERILAKLVGDDNFALPFWNWDNQSPDYEHLPNTMPLFFRNPDKYPGLYSKYRDARHQPGAPPAVVNLILDDVRSAGTKTAVTPEEMARQRAINNAHLHSLIVERTATGERHPFLSYPIHHGEELPHPEGWNDIFELQAHIAVHFWTGDSSMYYADMGVIYHGPRDPLFFVHHANVDRMWNVWLGLEGRSNYHEPDFLDAAFFFCDEDGEIVRVTVAEGLDNEQLGYTYQEVENPWVTYDASADAQVLLDTTSIGHVQA